MKFPATTAPRGERAYALLLVVILTGAGLLALSGAMSSTANTARYTQRNSDYFLNTGAADAAVEKVAGTIAQDYANSGEATVYANLSTYRSTLPTQSESSYWTNYQFSDTQGKVNVIAVDRTVSWTNGDLPSKYSGLRGNYASYRVMASARAASSSLSNYINIAKQELQLASIPIFQYELFYGLDLELCPTDDFNVYGRVHCNRSIYFQPDSGDTLTLQGDVTAAGSIYHTNSPGDPVSRHLGSIVYQGEHDTRAKVLKLPIGTTNTADMMHALIEIPPTSESSSSALGQQRFYNKADFIIIVSNNLVTAKSGLYNSFTTSIPWTTVNKFINTNITFYDKREGREVRATEIDVGKLNGQWSTLKSSLGRDPKTIFLADLSTGDTNSMPAVRMINAATLPSVGLTVATPHPIYVMGHYNTSGQNLGTTNTTKAYPAALAGDAVTLLSSRWSDTWSYSDFSLRNGANTTVNAAFITGIVPTGGGYYSGGAENSLRLLEDWTSKILTFNGAVAVLFDSRTATAPWGATDYVYVAPTRKWSWDLNFATYSKLPPSTPEFRTVLKSAFSSSQTNLNYTP